MEAITDAPIEFDPYDYKKQMELVEPIEGSFIKNPDLGYYEKTKPEDQSLVMKIYKNFVSGEKCLQKTVWDEQYFLDAGVDRMMLFESSITSQIIEYVVDEYKNYDYFSTMASFVYGLPVKFGGLLDYHVTDPLTPAKVLFPNVYRPFIDGFPGVGKFYAMIVATHTVEIHDFAIKAFRFRVDYLTKEYKRLTGNDIEITDEILDNTIGLNEDVENFENYNVVVSAGYDSNLWNVSYEEYVKKYPIILPMETTPEIMKKNILKYHKIFRDSERFPITNIDPTHIITEYIKFLLYSHSQLRPHINHILDVQEIDFNSLFKRLLELPIIFVKSDDVPPLSEAVCSPIPITTELDHFKVVKNLETPEMKDNKYTYVFNGKTIVFESWEHDILNLSQSTCSVCFKQYSQTRPANCFHPVHQNCALDPEKCAYCRGDMAEYDEDAVLNNRPGLNREMKFIFDSKNFTKLELLMIIYKSVWNFQ